ncbi:VOC family protein [Brevibacillus sp. H7]|uniref:VOC family protein n=1 Tax=Brevibacillus sp. H7 TaxID=3349138 RepID=UPI00381DBFAA
MFQLDRLVYATKRPDEIALTLKQERGLTLAASGQSFPGVATRIYPFPGGGFLEVTYIEDEAAAVSTESGKALHSFLQENGDGYYAMIVETDDLARVRHILEEEGYPVAVTPVQEVTDPAGDVVSFQMLGTYPHLPWFVQYGKPRQSPAGYPQAAFLRTTTLTADTAIMEKVLGQQATMVEYPDRTAAILPLRNASLRIETADAYGYAYFDPKGVLFENPADFS